MPPITAEILNETVATEIAALLEDMQARAGLEAMGEPHVKHLEGKLSQRKTKRRLFYIVRYADSAIADPGWIHFRESVPQRTACNRSEQTGRTGINPFFNTCL